MPRAILAQTELLPFLTPVQLTVKIIPGEEIHVQTLFVKEWAARTINQTLFTPKGNRVLDIRLRNEARDAYDQRKRKLKREQLFGEMSPEELNKLITTDRYFQFGKME